MRRVDQNLSAAERNRIGLLENDRLADPLGSAWRTRLRGAAGEGDLTRVHDPGGQPTWVWLWRWMRDQDPFTRSKEG